ncbi:unnamed protein product [Phaedon cochleariae]|uniref:Lipase domain-containing protein n=1 Tax=Phaedon cochleariae TaxID=80249 RepID=A0A9N9X0W5_PHACE|nr:unnamed protein product [Phaedon cochleariae]
MMVLINFLVLVWVSCDIISSSAIPVPGTKLSITAGFTDNDLLNAVHDDDIKIFFFGKNSSEGVQLNITDEKAVQNTSFSTTKQTFFVTHGWNNDKTSKMPRLIRKALLENYDVNVFIVDWSSHSKSLYSQAFLVIESMGKLLASKISALQNNTGLELGKTALIGHSLGSHISGVAGSALDGKIDYILGMDPAGPLFLYDDVSNRISPASAQFVQIMHTCGSILGFSKPLGMADYYPNGGMSQHGCGLDVTGSCSHSRSYYYYVESLKSGQFVAQKCESYDDFKKDKCFGSPSIMGGYNIDRSARGSYYLETNDKAPFAKSTNKTVSKF